MRESEERAAYTFDFRECHSPDVPVGGWADDEALVEHLRGCGWEPWDPTMGDPDGHCDPDIHSVADFESTARTVLVDEVGLPAEALQVAFDKLAGLMAAGGWAFAGGGYWEFAGNHNDNERYVVLRRPSAG